MDGIKTLVAQKTIDSFEKTLLSHTKNAFLVVEGESGVGKFTMIKQTLSRLGFKMVSDFELEKLALDDIYEEMMTLRYGATREHRFESNSKGDREFNPLKDLKKSLTNCSLFEYALIFSKYNYSGFNKKLIVLRCLPDLKNDYEKAKVEEMLKSITPQNDFYSIILCLNTSIYYVGYFEKLLARFKPVSNIVKTFLFHVNRPTIENIKSVIKHHYRLDIEDSILKTIITDCEKNFSVVLNRLELYKKTRKYHSDMWIANDNIFHKMGRILYNKRLDVNAKGSVTNKQFVGKDFDANKNRFYFDINEYVQSLNNEAHVIRGNIRENYLDFCTDIRDACRIAHGMTRLQRYDNTYENEHQTTVLYLLNYMNNNRHVITGVSVNLQFEKKLFRSTNRESKLERTLAGYQLQEADDYVIEDDISDDYCDKPKKKENFNYDQLCDEIESLNCI